MLSNSYFLAKFRFDTAENEPAKNLQNFIKILLTPRLVKPLRTRDRAELSAPAISAGGEALWAVAADLG